ncbi:hypothetical protein Droror1_Dr00018586 [Drosera rotundifolia]
MAMLEHNLHIAVGIMGNAASIFLYSSPILTFARVIRKKSTEEFSCVPYIIALLNSLFYSWYGSPVVSHGWQNFPIITIDGTGVVLELCFISIYFWFCPPKMKIRVFAGFISVIGVFCIAAATSAFVFHDHHSRRVFIGCFGLVASSSMYASPLVVMKKVIQTKSVEYMPFYLSLFSFLASSLWMAYGLLMHDFFLTAPNLVGCPLGIVQLVLYCIYNRKEIMEEKDQWDLEKNVDDFGKDIDDLKPKQIQLVISDDDDTNGKS